MFGALLRVISDAVVARNRLGLAINMHGVISDWEYHSWWEQSSCDCYEDLANRSRAFLLAFVVSGS